MDKEKNISITLKQPEEEKTGLEISFSAILVYLKKFFLLWFVAAVVLAFIIIGSTLCIGGISTDGNITALVGFNYEGIEEGLDPAGQPFNVNKIKAPTIIETALTEQNLSLRYSESVRKNITIKGITPDEAMNEYTLYKNVFSDGGSAALSAANQLLKIEYTPTEYVIDFNYIRAGLNQTDGKLVLDSILKAYQEYFFTEYGYNESLGNSVVAVDYKDYDYPSAIDVFDTTLSTLYEYVNKLSNQGLIFRSGKTGYSFNDLKRMIETIREADLYNVSSYIVINTVTNNKDYLLSYYEYKIEELGRQKNVAKTELDSISNSIDNYEKDKLLVVSENYETANANFTQTSPKYDALIEKKISKQRNLSTITQRIEYYKNRMNVLEKSNSNSTDENRAVAEKDLAELNEKINGLIDDVNTTADEYYEKVTFANAYNILVPATASQPIITTKNLVIPAVFAEFLLLAVYIMAALIKSILLSKKIKEKENKILEYEPTEK